MISSFPSYDEELLNSAYANIGLIADKAWSFDEEDPFQKFNRSLWIQYRKVAAKYKENANYRAKRVRDVIPDSRLASYGNYEYNEEREIIYKPDDGATSAPLPNFCWTEVTESWMLPDVEKYFGWLTSHGSPTNRESSTATVPEAENVSNIGCSLAPRWDDRSRTRRATRTNFRSVHVSDDESLPNQRTISIESDVAKEHYPHRRYTIENCMEMQLHVRVTSEAIRNLWKFGGNGQRLIGEKTRLHCYRLQQAREQSCRGKERPQQFYYAFQYRPLILRTAHTESYGTSRKHLTPVLSPEVAEFFPKVPTTRFDDNREQQNTNRVQYFPSLNETTYQNELFPYNRTGENIGTVFQQNTGVPPLLAATDTTTMFIRHPQRCYQRVPASVQIQSPSSNSVQALRASNVARYPIHLRNNVQEKFLQPKPVSIPVYQHPMELYRDTGQKRKNHGVDFKNLILLTKNAMKAHRGRSKEPHQRPTTYLLETRNRTSKTESTELPEWNVDGKPASGIGREKDESENSERPKREKSSNEKKDQSEIRNRRRLYRDVLTNASVNEAMFENVFEKRYDELEKQAMEQYRSSEESLALKYQELERQALEQYKCCENVEETDTRRSDVEDSTRNVENTNCFDGQKCSGFGRCSPAAVDARVKNQRDCSVEKQTNVSGTASKSESGNSEETLRDTAVYSKSFTAFRPSRKLSYGSKNASKGTSANKTDKRVRTSSKRRLILVSPFEKESEAKLTKTADLDEFYCIARGNKSIFGCYNRSKVGRIGGGDEKIAFMESPVTEGIRVVEKLTGNKNCDMLFNCTARLSGFWTT